MHYSKENILITPGSKEAMLLMHVAFKGEIILPAPSWVSYEPQARIGLNKVHWMQTKRENNWFPTAKELEKKLAHIKTPINLSIIGCVVNGPGEAAQTEIGLTGGGQDSNLLYLSGVPHTKVPSSKIIDRVVELVEEKIKEKN